MYNQWSPPDWSLKCCVKISASNSSKCPPPALFPISIWSWLAQLVVHLFFLSHFVPLPFLWTFPWSRGINSSVPWYTPPYILVSWIIGSVLPHRVIALLANWVSYYRVCLLTHSCFRWWKADSCTWNEQKRRMWLESSKRPPPYCQSDHDTIGGRALLFMLSHSSHKLCVMRFCVSVFHTNIK